MIEFDAASVVVPDSSGDGERVVLSPTSVTLGEQRVAVIGANGSGKSTLARLVNGLVTATTGAVHVDGVDVARRGREVRRRVAFTFTDPYAQLVMPTVAEDVALSLRAARPDRRGRDAAVAEVLEQHGLADLAHRSVHALSGGQAQLLALASALATGPDVLVADEPTTLLDLAASRRVGDLLMGLPQQVVLVTHDLELAGRCDRAVLVDGGRVVADGPAADVVHHYRARVAACC